jgi:hypothetical protein
LLHDLVRPHPEARQRVEAERDAQGDIRSIAAPRNEEPVNGHMGTRSHGSEQSLQQFVPVKLQVSGNITEDARQRTYLQGIVRRDGNVMLGRQVRREPQVAAGLAGNAVSKPRQRLGEIRS